MLRLAVAFGVPNPRDEITRVVRAVERWPEFTNSARLSEADIAKIALDHVDLAGGSVLTCRCARVRTGKRGRACGPTWERCAISCND
jgi:hypothetical protein